MEVSELIKKYLQQAQIMQIATASGSQPWVCSVHFVADDSLNLYWLSSPKTRHSQELVKNGKVAATIPVKHPEHPVIGVQVEGDGDVVKGDELEVALNLYDKKFQLSSQFKEKFLAGNDQEHELYRIKPRLFVLFDQVNFPDNPRKDWRP